MNENRVVSLRQKDEIDDPLTEILRTGARRLITRAVEVEFDTFLASNANLALPDGRQRVVRHGHDPVRAIQTGIGPVEVQKPKARDRGAPRAGERIRFASSILPKWARRTKRRAPAYSLSTTRSQSVAESHQRCQIPRRNRGRARSQIRRLIHAVT
jgi:putative transposase